MTTTVLFLPGLYGSTLHCERTGTLRWPALGEILLRRRSLAADAGTELRAGRVIDRFVVVPGLYAIDVYADALTTLRRRLGAGVEMRELAYDWRSELSSQVAVLDAAVDAEISRGRRVALVAHSLGGLLTCYYLRYGNQPIESARETWAGAAKIDSVALAGVPFGGSALALVDLVAGRRVAGNGRLLDAATYRSFGATWQLLPASESPLIDSHGEVVPLDLFDAQEWQRVALAPSHSDTERHLHCARRLRTLLAQPIESSPPRRLPMLLARGAGKPTLERVVYHANDRGHHFIDNMPQWRKLNADANERQLFGEGDGVVTLAASAVPAIWNEALAVQDLQVRRGHRRLLHDGAVQDAIAGLLGVAGTASRRLP